MPRLLGLFIYQSWFLFSFSILVACRSIGDIFPGFQIYELDNLNDVAGLTSACKTALSQTIRCHPFLKTFKSRNVGKYIDDVMEADMVCAPSCGDSLKSWFDNVSSDCINQTLGYSDPTRHGGYMYAGYNQTCHKNPETGQYCQSIMNEYPTVASIRSMSTADMCSYCFKQKYIMMQASAYTAYDVRAQENLKIINRECGLNKPTEMSESLVKVPDSSKPMCLTGMTYIIQENDTCDKIALKYIVASAAIQDGNSELINDCSYLIAGREICIPLSCENIYTLQDNDTCFSIEDSGLVEYGGVRKFNPWLDGNCWHLQSARQIRGSVICLSPQGGTYDYNKFVSNARSSGPPASTGYTSEPIGPLENATVAEGSAWFCGLYHTVTEGETCTSICMEDRITAELFLDANPSLSPDDCDGSLVVGLTYCTGPDEYWDDARFWGKELWPGSPWGPVSSSSSLTPSAPTDSP